MLKPGQEVVFSSFRRTIEQIDAVLEDCDHRIAEREKRLKGIGSYVLGLRARHLAAGAEAKAGYEAQIAQATEQRAKTQRELGELKELKAKFLKARLDQERLDTQTDELFRQKPIGLA